MNTLLFVGDCEQKIASLRSDVVSQQNSIQMFRRDAATLKQQSQSLRNQADSNVMIGTAHRSDMTLKIFKKFMF